MYAATAAAPRGGASEGALLTQYTEYGQLEAGASLEPLAGSLVSLASLTPDGDGNGLRLYSDVPLTSAILTRSGASLRCELRDHRGLPACPAACPKSTSRRMSWPSTSTWGWSPLCRPRRSQTPRHRGCRPRSGGWGSWEGPGEWRKALEDEFTRVFVEFGSTRVVPARRRREHIGRYGRGKVYALRLAVPLKEKRNADGSTTGKEARVTAGDLTSNGKIPGMFSVNPAGETSRLMTQLGLKFKGARATHKGVWAGGGYFHGKQPDIELASGRAIFAPIPLGWAGLGTKHGLCFEAYRRGESMTLQVVGGALGLQNAVVMWVDMFTEFLLGFGFTQSTVGVSTSSTRPGSCSWWAASEFGSTKVVPARRRREHTGRYGRGKVSTPRFVVPLKEKRNADGAATGKEARITAGDLTSYGKIPGMFSANLAGETSR